MLRNAVGLEAPTRALGCVDSQLFESPRGAVCVPARRARKARDKRDPPALAGQVPDRAPLCGERNTAGTERRP